MANSERRLINTNRWGGNASTLLLPLLDIATGAAIPGFPTTMADFVNLDGKSPFGTTKY